MKAIKNILNFALVILLLIATTGVTLDKHYCLGRLQSIAINEQAKDCDGEEENMPCCTSDSQKLKVENLDAPSFDFKCEVKLVSLLPQLSVIELPQIMEENYQQWAFSNTVPIPKVDRIILLETYLI